MHALLDLLYWYYMCKHQLVLLPEDYYHTEGSFGFTGFQTLGFFPMCSICFKPLILKDCCQIDLIPKFSKY